MQYKKKKRNFSIYPHRQSFLNTQICCWHINAMVAYQMAYVYAVCVCALVVVKMIDKMSSLSTCLAYPVVFYTQILLLHNYACVVFFTLYLSYIFRWHFFLSTLVFVYVCILYDIVMQIGIFDLFCSCHKNCMFHSVWIYDDCIMVQGNDCQLYISEKRKRGRVRVRVR